MESAAGEHSTMTSYAIAHGDFDGDGNLGKNGCLDIVFVYISLLVCTVLDYWMAE